MNPSWEGGLPKPSRRRVLVRDTRSAEAYLIYRVQEFVRATRADPGLLATPLRVVVPSGGLRDHLSARLVSALGGADGAGGAALALKVQTLDALAHEVLARAGAEPRRAELLLDVFVRRAAAEEPLLEQLLGHLEDGFAPLVGVVRDLFDAGLDEDTAAPFDEAVQSLTVAPRRLERLRAIARVAHRVRSMANAQGLLLASDLFGAAARHLADNASPYDPLPTLGCLAHGFADVTGRAGELLDALAHRVPLEFLLERPAQVSRAEAGATDTTEELTEDRSARFGDRLRERLVGSLPEELPLPAAPSPNLRLESAPTRMAEVRAVANSIRTLLDAGLAPENIAVVARDLTPMRAPLAVTFGRLGIPFSARQATGLADAATGRLNALLALLERGPQCGIDSWLAVEGQAGPDVDDPKERLPLDVPQTRLALGVLGLARLEDVAGVDLVERLGGRRALELPLRKGRAIDPPTGTEGLPDLDVEEDLDSRIESAPQRGTRGSRRWVAFEHLRRTSERARDVVLFLGQWSQAATGSVHAETLRAFVRERLGWTPEDHTGGALQRLELALSSLWMSTHEELLTRKEFVSVLRESCKPIARPLLGGRGGGVRVLGAMEARGHAFEHLFLIGLERGAFPRAGGEDALLPDSLRSPLSEVLPDMPLKARRGDEERFLFSSLCAAAEHVHLSYALSDGRGGSLLPSPFFTRLWQEFGVSDSETGSAPGSVQQRARPEDPPPRTAPEVATLVALSPQNFDRVALGRARGLALLEAGVAPRQVAALNRQRQAVLDEIEGRGAAAHRPGPWYGLLGSSGTGRVWPDPARETQPVTALERFATCGWQLFLERVLRLEPLPDPAAALPGIDARQLGNTVHRALEAVALGRFPVAEQGRHDNPAATRERERTLAQVLDGKGQPPSWPAAASELFDLALEAARRELQDSGVPLPGLVRGLARRALPYLEAARDRLGDDDPGRVVLGAEVAGTITLGSEEREDLSLTFRIDRVDRVTDPDGGHVELIDYKTGKPWFDSKQANTRTKKTLAGIRAGTRLQGIAYAEGVQAKGTRGRYLFLKQGLAPHTQTIDVDRNDPDYAKMSQALTEAVMLSTAAWRAGAFLPRLFELGAPKKTNPACEWCRVAEACNRLESSATARLRRWVEEPQEHGEHNVLLAHARRAMTMDTNRRSSGD